jgi:hypothetical protein
MMYGAGGEGEERLFNVRGGVEGPGVEGEERLLQQRRYTSHVRTVPHP